MRRYYDVTLKKENINSSISFWADAFSVDKNGILRVQSEGCGNVTVQIEPDEVLSVSTVDVLDEFEEMIEKERGEE